MNTVNLNRTRQRLNLPEGGGVGTVRFWNLTLKLAPNLLVLRIERAKLEDDLPAIVATPIFILPNQSNPKLKPL